MPPYYHLRPGTWSDVPASAVLYMKSFDKEPLLDYMFPGRQTNPQAFHTWITRRFRLRYWTPGYFLTMVVAYDDDEEEEHDDEKDHLSRIDDRQGKPQKKNRQGRPVGFTWWHRPAESLSFYQRWLSPSALFRPFIASLLRLQDYLFPIPFIDPHKLAIYDRTFALIEPQVLNSPRRRSAWYVASLGVDPVVQGRGIGGMLIRDGLAQADRAGAAAWLVGLRGLERYYSRFGFAEVARANVGELKDWKGGSVMFRND
ncbi:hypothetical protein B0T10DRAFT_469360 [Thelonectria olida]|uniref:N-acetyltransferase domain-containing protein n=1 Tax=Thelonectria olida TaxID=1576542 RepID=A0A9P8WLK5_9HYPO|nr:hypothetical protein B0T10DRAFT_469360 [Thelonectria olida]